MVTNKAKSMKVASLLLPTQRYLLLLPNTAVKEVLPPRHVDENTSAPQFVIGHTTLSDGSIIPVLDFDFLDQEQSRYEDEKKPIVVIRESNFNSGKPFGLLANKAPRIIYSSEQNLETDFNPSRINDYVLSYVIIANEAAVIPDLEKISALLAET